MRKVFFVMFLAGILGFGFFTVAYGDLIDNGGGLIYDTDLNVTWYDFTYIVAVPYVDGGQYFDRNYWAPAVD